VNEELLRVRLWQIILPFTRPSWQSWTCQKSAAQLAPVPNTTPKKLADQIGTWQVHRHVIRDVRWGCVARLRRPPTVATGSLPAEWANVKHKLFSRR